MLPSDTSWLFKPTTVVHQFGGGSAALTTVAFNRSGPRWLGISDLIAEPEGPTFISRKVARSRLNRLRFVTQDPLQTLWLPVSAEFAAALAHTGPLLSGPAIV